MPVINDEPVTDFEVPPKVQISNSPVYNTGVRLGKGGFGQVFKGTRAGRARSSKNAEAKPAEVALKFEHKTSKTCNGSSPHEWSIYQALGDVYGVPKVYFKGSCGDCYVMIMDLLGSSLWDIWSKSRMDLKYVACIAIEAITILECVHKKGYVHGDIKPENFLLGQPGTAAAKKLYLVDFGLTQRWRNNRGKHVPYDQHPDDFRGTVRYASVHAHLGRTPSRRDDLESLAYTLMFFMNGRLPWQGFTGNCKTFLVGRKKMQTSANALTRAGGENFKPFGQFIDAIYNLKFDEEPRYAAYIKLFEPLVKYEEGVARPLEVSNALAIGKKRGRDDLELLKEDMEEKESKKIRKGTIACQWITVYNRKMPMKQRYHYNVSDDRLEVHVQKGWDDNLYISSITNCGGYWGIIMDGGTNFISQKYHISPRVDPAENHGFLPKSWIMEQWDEGFYITAAAGNSHGGSLVVMSQGTNYTQQSYKIANVFPYEWIKKKWREGFWITTVATSGMDWAIIMTKGVMFSQQVVEIDFQYPSEGIHQRWNAGYRITAVGATSEQAAFVLSIPRHENNETQEETLRTSTFPSEHVKEKWEKDLYIAAIAYGRTVT